MRASTYCTKKHEVVTRKIAGETVIVPIKSGVGDLNFIYTLNHPGTMIWELLGEGATLAQILSSVCREYDVPEETAERDIRDFLISMQAEGLVCSSQESGG